MMRFFNALYTIFGCCMPPLSHDATFQEEIRPFHEGVSPTTNDILGTVEHLVVQVQEEEKKKKSDNHVDYVEVRKKLVKNSPFSLLFSGLTCCGPCGS